MPIHEGGTVASASEPNRIAGLARVSTRACRSLIFQIANAETVELATTS